MGRRSSQSEQALYHSYRRCVKGERRSTKWPSMSIMKFGGNYLLALSEVMTAC